VRVRTPFASRGRTGGTGQDPAAEPSPPAAPKTPGAPNAPGAPGLPRAAWLALPRRRARRPGQWIGVALLVAFVGLVASSLIRNKAAGYPVIGHYLFSGAILSGVRVTVELSAICLVTGIVLGGCVAAMRRSGSVVLSTIARVYIWVLRSVPPLVQVLFWYNLGALYPHLVFRIPLAGWTVLDTNTDTVIHAFTAALIALSLNEAAYQAEIIRAGIQAPGEGQRETAAALGLSGAQAMALVVLPQSLRVLIPTIANQFIHLVKTTSIVSFIALSDLLFATEIIYNRTDQVTPLLFVAIIWYLAIIGVATVIQVRLERLLRW
jgi:polar amino acid transport system permease protein